jgi:nitroimidazol reductase NimA-like FMN-containing flavoprotein (pyridoxamine 5'-phosphate oxidase superfamily)
MRAVTTGRLVALGPEECLRLLHEHHLGRLAVVIEGQPLIFPVNYAVTGHQIVFRTDAGTKLLAAEGQRVAFEIDDSDPQYHDGWSVLVVGIAREERDATHMRELEQLPLRPWIAGSKSHWMCIGGGAITGRRLTHHTENR